MDGQEENSLNEKQEKPEDDSKETLELMKELFDGFNKTHLLEFIKLANNPKKLCCLNFLAGLAQGLGLTIGTAIVLTFLFKLIQHIIALNIPYITVWISEWINQISVLVQAVK